MVERVAVSCGDGEKDASSRQTREENSDNPQGSLLTNSEVYSSRVFSNVWIVMSEENPYKSFHTIFIQHIEHIDDFKGI